MASYDGLSIPVHEGFKSLHGQPYGSVVNNFMCSYYYDLPPIHSNLYIWLRNGVPVLAFTGSADFVQSAFVSTRKEVLVSCAPQEAFEYYNNIIPKTIFCTHHEVENQITLKPFHPILDEENNPLLTLEGDGIASVQLSLLARSGETGRRSGLNWGQRGSRNRNEAYIPVPRKISTGSFFPVGTHFTTVTDDGYTLILRIEQQGNKAITTPQSNALLGEYFRGRLGLANGDFITKQHLLDYGRTNVTFYKIDDEQYFMDFSSQPPISENVS